MNSTDVFNRFDKIINGRLSSGNTKGKAGLATTANTNDATKNEPETALKKEKLAILKDGENAEFGQDGDNKITNWIPEIKRLVQFPDMRMNVQVLPIEDYSHKRIRTEKEIDRRWREHAIILRRELDAGLNLVHYRLEIRSPTLRNIVKRICRPWTELNLEASPIEQIQALIESRETSSVAKSELRELLSFVSTEPTLQRIIIPYDDLVPKGKIRRNLHWALFRPHEWVYISGITSVWKDVDYTNEGCIFTTSIEQRYPGDVSVDTLTHCLRYIGLLHDGRNFGIFDGSWFFGSRSQEIVDISVKNLGAIPMRLMPADEQEKIRTRLIARGKKYCELSSASHCYMQYHGPVGLSPRDNSKHLGTITGNSNQFNRNWITNQRVVIDRRAEMEMTGPREKMRPVAPCFKEYLGYTAHDTEDGDEEAANMYDSDSDGTVSTASLSLSSATSDSVPDVDALALRRKERKRQKAIAWENRQLSDEDFLMCPPIIVAFLLHEKIWASHISVSKLEKITWKQDPFDALQLPQEKKHLVRSLVKGFNAKAEKRKGIHYEDIIEGKGKGLVFLLHGPPGLGKTLTAESVAESTGRPLYHVSTGELSTQVAVLEKQLTDLFRLGLRWGAVVLLDEADVLMAKRTTTELDRNAIVAVFLRLVEYYNGILFLTTNRFEDFDNAFYNRIHVAIRYHTLQSPERTNIWRQHLYRAVGGTADGGAAGLWWTEEACQLLGQIETNGRDIRNYTRTAYGYAQGLGEDLSIRHIVTVIRNNLDVSESSDVGETLRKLEALQEQLETQPRAEARRDPVGEEDQSDAEDGSPRQRDVKLEA